MADDSHPSSHLSSDFLRVSPLTSKSGASSPKAPPLSHPQRYGNQPTATPVGALRDFGGPETGAGSKEGATSSGELRALVLPQLSTVLQSNGTFIFIRENPQKFNLGKNVCDICL